MKGDLFYPPRVFAGLPASAAELETSRVVVLQVPYDSTTEWRGGARDGPIAIIDASQYLELYDHELGREVFQVGIHTLPELQPAMGGPSEMIERVYEVAGELLALNKLVVMLGGEHSLTIGMARAFRERFPRLSVLQLDAHADLRDEYLGTRYSHACVMRRVVELCPIVQVGIRSLSYEEQVFIERNGMRPFYAEGRALDTDGILSSLSDEVYITIDLDVLDPSIMSAVGTPEPGGLGWYEVLGLLREVASRKRVLGFDLVELSPREGQSPAPSLPQSSLTSSSAISHNLDL